MVVSIDLIRCYFEILSNHYNMFKVKIRKFSLVEKTDLFTSIIYNDLMKFQNKHLLYTHLP
jgi:hypothetical protein